MTDGAGEATHCITDLKERTVGVDYEVGEYEYDCHITLKAPEEAPGEDMTIIRLTRGDLKDGFSYNFKEQYLEAFLELPDIGPVSG